MLDLSYSLLEGLWYSDNETEEGFWWLGGCGEGEETVERRGEGASFGEREWYEETPSGGGFVIDFVLIFVFVIVILIVFVIFLTGLNLNCRGV